MRKKYLIVSVVRNDRIQYVVKSKKWWYPFWGMEYGDVGYVKFFKTIESAQEYIELLKRHNLPVRLEETK